MLVVVLGDIMVASRAWVCDRVVAVAAESPSCVRPKVFCDVGVDAASHFVSWGPSTVIRRDDVAARDR